LFKYRAQIYFAQRPVPHYAMFTGCIISHEVRYSQCIWA